MRRPRARLTALIALLVTCSGCGSDICEEARQAFCDKACDCEEAGCVARLAQAGLQYYDDVSECLELAGPQVCDSEGTEGDADACTAAVADMASCGGSVAPEACRPVPVPGSGEP